jgi:uncharacterized protein
MLNPSPPAEQLNGTSRAMQPVGYVVGESHPQEFVFVSSSEVIPPLLEYIVTTVRQPGADARDQLVRVLSQVAQIGVDSNVLSEALTYEETRTILAGAFAPAPKVLARARVIGYLDGNVVRMPRTSALPGAPVNVADDDMLRLFFSATGKGRLNIGTLLNRPSISVSLDVNGLRRHAAVLAQTGAGKSYMVGRLLECLVGDLGGTVLVLDPNSDYVQLRKSLTDAERPYNSAAKTSFADRVDIFRVPGVQGRRLTDELVGPSRDFTVRFAALEHAEMADLAGVPANATRIREAISIAAQYLTDNGHPDFRPDDLHRYLQAVAGESATPSFGPTGTPVGAASDTRDRTAARNALVYVDSLRAFGIWGFQDVPIDDLLRPKRLTVVDLAGVEKVVASYVADKALREIWSRALTGRLPYPVFIVLEEAHNLVPPGGGRASRIINTIAAEGRKFKVFLLVVTQRPSKVHPDTLSQCGSQLVMRLTNPDDQRAVRQSSELMSEDLLGNLPSLNTGEVIVVGPLARVPAMIRVGQRYSAEGGSDIDLAAALEQATDDARVATVADDRMERPPSATTVTRERYL